MYRRIAIHTLAALTLLACGDDIPARRSAAGTGGLGGAVGAGGFGGAPMGGATASGGVSMGGFPTSGGTVGLGGDPTASGGVAGSGGSSAGGVNGGGMANPGGAPGAGGAISDGGAPAAGGAISDGGAPAAGGAISDGGAPAAGGMPGTGGSGGELPKFVGNITTSGRVNPNGLEFKTYWNQITPENAGKWGSVQSTPNSQFNWSTLDAIYDYAESNGVIFKQHTFVWGSQQPNGVPSQDQVINWIRSFCERYPNTRLIDVVNEPPPHTTPNYANNIGGGTGSSWQWITNAFKWARQYCPGAILILNDYNNIEWPNDNQNFINIAKAVLAAGGPIDAVGAQAHGMSGGGQVTLQRVTDLFNKLHNDTGLPVYITELDLDFSNDQQQLSAYQQFFPLFMNAEFVHGITIWGWIYGATWVPSSGLVRNGSSRPAMSWLMGQLGRPTP